MLYSKYNHFKGPSTIIKLGSSRNCCSWRFLHAISTWITWLLLLVYNCKATTYCNSCSYCCYIQYTYMLYCRLLLINFTKKIFPSLVLLCSSCSWITEQLPCTEQLGENWSLRRVRSFISEELLQPCHRASVPVWHRPGPRTPSLLRFHTNIQWRGFYMLNVKKGTPVTSPLLSLVPWITKHNVIVSGSRTEYSVGLFCSLSLQMLRN